MFISALLSAALASAALAAPPQDDPVRWRDRGPQVPAAAWDALEGQPFPTLEHLKVWVNTRPLSWEDLRGHVVLVQYFATWRKPAMRDLPQMVELFERHRDEGLVVLCVHARKDSEGFVRLVEGRGLPFAVAIDVHGGLGRATSTRRFPSYHLVDREGRVRVAGVNPDAAVMAEVVAHVLAEPWEGTRREIEYVPRRWSARSKAPPPPLRLGPGGWPETPADQRLNARRDVRGKQAPPFEASLWLTPAIDVRERPYVVLVWATYASTCFAALDRLQELHERFGPRLAVVGVSEQTPDKVWRAERNPWNNTVRHLLDQKPRLSFAQALDGPELLKRGLGVIGMPHALLVDSRGIVRWQGNPVSDEHPLTDEVVARMLAIDALRNGRPSLRRVGDALELEEAPPQVRGSVVWLPASDRVFRAGLALGGGTAPVPLGAVAPTDNHGRVRIELDAAPMPLGVGALGWISWRPTGYSGPVAWARAQG
jgi:cytochrome c biogenesis protein CcmG, thiol:disulfide interchange protein DsbE